MKISILETLCRCSYYDSKSLEGVGQGWNGGILLAGGGSKIWKNNETMESGRIETLWDTVHKGIPCYAVGQKEKRKGKGKVRRLDRATYKAVQAKGIKSFRRDFNQDPGELAETRVG